MKKREASPLARTCPFMPAVIALLLPCLSPATAAAGTTNDLFEAEMTVVNPAGGSAILDMSREDGFWLPVMVGWRAYGANAQYGYVVSNEVTDTSMRFEIAINWCGDAWIPGYYGSCSVAVTKGTGTVWFGQAEMRDPARTYTNNVTCRIKVSRPIRYPDWRPMEGDEHPRILVRKYELSRLREKLATPFGQKAKGMMQGDLLGLALLYQLTQDKSYAERTIPMFEHALTVMDGGHVGGNFRMHQRNVGMAYDLCIDALPSDLCSRVEDYLGRFADAGIDKLHWLSSGMNTHPCCNYYGPIIGSFAIASLVFAGRPGPAPVEPLRPMGLAQKTDSLSKLVDKYSSAAKTDALRRDYEFKLAEWKAQMAWWKENGGQDPTKSLLTARMWYQMYRHYRLGIGDGGFQSESYAYSTYAHNNPVTYAAMYQRVFGRDASAFPDATHYLPRQMMEEFYPANGGGRGYGQEIQGGCGVQAGLVAEAFNGIAEEYKPAMLWVWNYLTGVTNEAAVARALNAGPVFAFINYPLDMKSEHPSKIMPLTWQAPTRGLYVFRSGWEGRDEFISQVFTKSTPIGGHNQPNAGTFRVFGLGHKWVANCGSKGIYERELHSVVTLPDDTINGGGCGNVTWIRSETNGSGEVTVNYDLLYGLGALREAPVQEENADTQPEAKAHPITRAELLARKDKAKRGQSRASLVDANFVKYPRNLAQGSIKGWRSIAFDYSGKSGAPCLLAMVDKVEGGKRKEWTWQAPLQNEEKNVAKVRVEKSTFVLDYGDANMRATFISPAKVDIRHDTGSDAVVRAGSAVHGSGMQALTFERNMIRASGETGTEGLFIMVATFQKGTPPEVRTQGDGLATVVHVGSQTVRLVEDRIVIGQ